MSGAIPVVPGPTAGRDRVTVREIAWAAGVSHSTVSRALRGSPLVTRATRERLTRLAAELGYRPDPLLSALASYRGRDRAPRKEPAFAFVVGRHLLEAWRGIVSGARSRAESLGYLLTPYVWDDALEAGRQREILEHRGVRGIVLGPLGRGDQQAAVADWPASFAVVALGRFLEAPPFPVVTPDHFGSVGLALRRIVDHGHDRVGLALLGRHDARTGGRILAAWLAAEGKPGMPTLVPPLVGDDEDALPDAMADWVVREQPGVVLAYEHLRAPLLARLPDGFPPPAFVALNLDSRLVGRMAGIDLRQELLGAHAVGQLHAQLAASGAQATDAGIVVEVPCLWRDGNTLPRLRASSLPRPAS